MDLKILEETYKVIQLKPDEKINFDLLNGEIFSVTKTDEELSIVVKSDVNIESDVVEDNWRAIKIVGILDFSLIGILSKISTILANANISIFAISTYNTDYILVKNEKLEQSIQVLQENGYRIVV